jgi:hypothetical protein
MIATAVATLALLASPSPAVVAKHRDQAFRANFGTGASCDVYARDLYGRLRAAGIRARLINVFASPRNAYDAHTFVESKTPQGWQISDPTFNGYWTIDGRRSSAADIQDALVRDGARHVIWHGRREPIKSYYVDPLVLFKRVDYWEQDAAGTWRQTGRRVARLAELYYGHLGPRLSQAKVVLVEGGSSWTIGPYPLNRAPDGRWISPIAYLNPAQLTGTGQGKVTVLSVRRLALDQIDAERRGSPRASPRSDAIGAG